MRETPPIHHVASTRAPGTPDAAGPVGAPSGSSTPRHLARVALGAAAATAATLGVAVAGGVVPLSDVGISGASLAVGPVPDLPTTGVPTATDVARDRAGDAVSDLGPTASSPDTTSARITPPTATSAPVPRGDVAPPVAVPPRLPVAPPVAVPPRLPVAPPVRPAPSASVDGPAAPSLPTTPEETTAPEPTAPEPSDPKPSDPEPSDPKPSDPEPSDPKPTGPPDRGDAGNPDAGPGGGAGVGGAGEGRAGAGGPSSSGAPGLPPQRQINASG